jgi:hypothetical protein
MDMRRLLVKALIAVPLLLLGMTASGWAAQVFEAEECVDVAPSAITSDSQANDGKGAKAVLLTPGGPGLSNETEVVPGIYRLSLIARNGEGKAGADLMALEVQEHKTGRVRSWTMPVAYGGQYGEVGRMYFPAHAGGKYTLKTSLVLAAPGIAADRGTLGGDPGGTEKFSLDPKAKTLLTPPVPLLVDRLEIGDALENCPKKGLKTRRMLTTDEELATIRRDFAEQFAKGRIDLRGRDYDVLTPSPPERSPEARRARNDEVWGIVPDYNDLIEIESPRYRRLFGYRRSGFIADSADLYEQTGNNEIGWDAAVSLCSLAEKYPGFDASVQLVAGYRYAVYADKYGDIGRMVTAYDQVFDFIKDNQALADYVGSKVAWVKTPGDVARFLDIYLLQASFEALYHTYEARGVGRPVGALIALVQGVCGESDQILERGVFRYFEGTLPHKFFVWGPLDDISYISPSREDIWLVASYLERYRRAGGSARYDLSERHPGFSTQREIRRWEQVHLSGGFRAGSPSWVNETRTKFWPHWAEAGASDVGGHMRMFVTITESSPSRVMEDVSGTHIAMGLYRLSILESGQFQDDLLKMRGSWVQYNALGLPLQATAHGGLSLSHFNRQSHQELGAPAIPGRDAPNKAFNIVEVDSLRNFPRVNLSGLNYLVGEGTTFPAGTNTCFAPLSGAQFMEHRQMPFRNVSLYMRQDAMIDVGDAESYVFDVVRVRGGKMHAYCLNAFPGKFESNVQMLPVSPADGPAWDECLQGYYDGMRSQGANPPVVQADWVMDPVVQKAHQDQDMAMTTPALQARKIAEPQFRCNQYDPNLPVTTRASVLGHPDDRVMVGHWRTVKPALDWWVLYVQGRQQEEGRESVYPVIIETFAGKPFLGEKRLVSVTPEQKGAEASVGAEVRTVDGRTDLLYGSVRPQDVATVSGRARMSGRFAMISSDGDGLRQMCIVGGSELSGADVLVKPDRTGYDLKIVDANYDERSLTVDGAIPTRLLRNEHVTMDVSGKPYRFKVINLEKQGEGTRLYYEGAAVKIYQSDLAGVQETERRVMAQIPPYTVRVGMTVTNEKQDRFWRVEELPEGLDKRMKGPCWLKLAGGVKTGDFIDANGDGKTKVSGCLFGPGDRVTTDTHVNVQRLAPGEYRVDSNVGCTIGLPAGDYARMEIGTDGKKFVPILCQRDGARLVAKVSEADLADGSARLRLVK